MITEKGTEMAGLMTFADGSVEAVLTYDDFAYYVGKYMGRDAADYFEALVVRLADYEKSLNDIYEFENALEVLSDKYKRMRLYNEDIKDDLPEDLLCILNRFSRKHQ